MTKITNKPKDWSLEEIWNKTLSEEEDRPIKPREYFYASEVGSPFLDTFYKMRGIPYSTDKTTVTKRKMEAGKMWEAIVRMVYKRAGILQEYQEKIDFALPGLLPVHGYLDFMTGGKVNVDEARKFITELKQIFKILALPDTLNKIADNAYKMVEDMREGKYANLVEYPSDLKSVSDFVWTILENTGKCSPTHENQVFHYTYGKKKPVGRLTFINRDDCRIKEMKVYNNEETLNNYRAWVTQMTDYWNAQEEPPKEPYITYNPITCQFYKNTMGVEWSPYLKLIYGFESAHDFRELVAPRVRRANAVIKRCVEEKKMTPLNKEVIADMKKDFPDWDDLVDQAKQRKSVLLEAGEVEEITEE